MGRTSTAAPADIIAFYTRYLSPGMTDLSASSAPPMTLAPTVADAAAHSSPIHPVELRRLIAARYERLSEDDIVLANGASEALAAVAHVLLAGGGRYLAPPGAYPSFLAAANRVGARAADSLDQPASVHLVVNPTVPAGALLDVAERIRRASAAGATLVADEVYRELTPWAPPRAVADIDARAVSIGDLSKPLGLGGLRIGWVATRDRDLLDAVGREIELLSGGPSTLSAAAAMGAMAGMDAHIAATLLLRQTNGAAVRALLTRFRWTFDPPASGLTVAATPPSPVDDEALVSLRERDLFLVPGCVLGAPGVFRISLLADAVQLECALSALASKAARRRDARQELIILTRAPLAGMAKTRLAAEVGRAAADRLAAAFLQDTLELGAAGPWERRIAVAPASAVEAVASVAAGWTCEAQPEGDLGDRILGALGSATRRGGEAVLIGSDTPDLPPAIVAEAFAMLASYDLVLGPAEDGGFYLIGAHAEHPGLFRNVAWSTPTVLASVVANACALGLSVRQLACWADVDDRASLAALRRRDHGGPATATRQALRELGAGEMN